MHSHPNTAMAALVFIVAVLVAVLVFRWLIEKLLESADDDLHQLAEAMELSHRAGLARLAESQYKASLLLKKSPSKNEATKS